MLSKSETASETETIGRPRDLWKKSRSARLPHLGMQSACLRKCMSLQSFKDSAQSGFWDVERPAFLEIVDLSTSACFYALYHA